MARQPNLEYATLTNCRIKGGTKRNVFTLADVAAFTLDTDLSGLKIAIPDLTADLTITLPTPSPGLEFEFFYVGAAADAQDWIFSAGTGNAIFFKGGVVFIDLDTDVVAPVYSDGNSNEVFTVLTPEVGTRIKLHGVSSTVWYVDGQVCSATVPTFAD